MHLPDGTITFLFTDIEGSTRLWEEQPDTMRLALARHDALLRAAIETNGGTVFKTIGDAFCAAFPTAPQALEAALSAQQSLCQVKAGVGSDLRLKVRMALHTGAAEPREGDYFGQPLNRVARLLAVGHGEQVLLSLATQQLVRDSLPAHVSLKDLGDHRLKDLARAETVFQLLHPNLPSDFLPLRSLDNPTLPNNLPQQMTSFIGREQEIAAIKMLLTKTRLLTLTGSGGCGKTRLSLQVAAEVLETYPDGVWLVELAPLTDPSLVPQTVAEVLGVREAPGESITKTLLSALKDRQMLLVLDNCEHLLEASARLVYSLLHSCPKVRLLVTSREALGIGGESTYRVPSLSLPAPGKAHTPDSLSEYESIRLFIERAVAVKADFVLTSQNASAQVSVCQRLDGIPLALELAAARIRSMTVEELGKRLDDRFRLLTGGSRTALPRHQTLRAMIDWSYDLLTQNQQALLARLCVFAGGWTLEAAEQVCADETMEDWEMLDLLTALCDKSLVLAEEQGETTRYRLLETVRQYAREKLAASGEAETIRLRHQQFYLALAEEAEPCLRGPEQSEWFRRLEREHDNLRAAQEAEDRAASLRIAGALLRFWTVRGHLREGRERMIEVLRQAGESAEVRARIKTLTGAGGLAGAQGDYASARTLYEQSLAIFRELGDKGGIAASLNNLGDLARLQGDYAVARTVLEESLAIRKELGNKAGIATSLGYLGFVACDQGDYASARMLFEQRLAIRRELGDKRGIAYSLDSLGQVAFDQGDYASARTLLEQSLAIFRELGDKAGIATSLNNSGLIARDHGDNTYARMLLEEGLAIQRELGDKWGISNSLNNLAGVVRNQGDYTSAWQLSGQSLEIRRELGDKVGIAYSLEFFAPLAAALKQTQRAVRLWGAAQRLRQEIGAPLPANEQEEYDRNVTAARQELGEAVFSAAWEEGQAMTLEQAMVVALEKEA